MSIKSVMITLTLATLTLSGPSLLSGCASNPNKAQASNTTKTPKPKSEKNLKNSKVFEEDLVSLAMLRPKNHHETLSIGAEFFSRYAVITQKAARTRKMINIGTWLASTYSAGSAGLNAHGNNVIAGTLLGTSLSQLEPIVSPGGPESSGNSMAQVSCVMKEVSFFIDAVDGIEGYETTDAYKAVNAYAMSAYLVIYQQNLNARRPVLVKSSDLQTAMDKADEKQARILAEKEASGEPKSIGRTLVPEEINGHKDIFKKRTDQCFIAPNTMNSSS
jgi:hypothetical protein